MSAIYLILSVTNSGNVCMVSEGRFELKEFYNIQFIHSIIDSAVM